MSGSAKIANHTSEPLPSGTDIQLPWHLRLPGMLEREFILYLLKFSQRVIFASIFVVLIIYASVVYFEQQLDAELIQQTWRLRLLSLMPMAALWWLCQKDGHVAAIQPLVATSALVLATSHDFLAMSVQHEFAFCYYLANIFAILLMSTLFRISLLWALASNLVILVSLTLSLKLNTHMPGALKPIILYIITGCTLLSLVGHYFFERLMRQHFLAERVMDLHRNELHSANMALESQAAEDALTGTVNRRGMEIRLGSLIHHARHNQQIDQLYVLLFDIDFFKQFNDTYGHLEGDGCLKQVSAVPKSMIQSELDFVARYGGEEFVVALSGITLNDALVFAERMRSRIERLGIAHTGSRVSKVVTVSIGVAGLVPGVNRADELIKRADEALYEAKGIGRNRTVLLDDKNNLVPQ